MFLCTQMLIICIVNAVNAKEQVSQVFFRRISVDDVNLSTTGVHVDLDSQLDCASRCVLSQECVAFNATKNGDCYVLKRSTTKNWKEKASGWVDLMVRYDWIIPNCSASSFPYLRGRSRYRLEKVTLTWNEAATFCHSLGAKLVQFTTTSEQVFVYNNLIKGTNKYALIGAKFVSGVWRWHMSNDTLALGPHLTPFWTRNEPTYRGEDSGMMYYRDGLINDVRSSSKYYAICECFIV